MYFLVLFALTFCTLIKSDCLVDETFVRGKNYALFSGNHLMRTPYVRDGTTLNLVCGGGAIVQRRCSGNTFRLPLPVTDCGENALPATIEIGNDASCPATLYIVGYTHRRLFTELYRTCYNPATMELIYVQNQVHKRPFEGKRPNCDFTLDEILVENDGNSFLKTNVYERFRKLLGDNQNFAKKKRKADKETIVSIIDRGHMVSAGEFLFHLNKCATFKYINVVPQFATINQNNWILVENYASTYFPNNRQMNNIKTGSFGILELPHSQIPNKMVKMYLLDNKNPIPKYIYKIINSEVVFVSYNNPFANALPNNLPCQPIACPNIIKYPKTQSLTDFVNGYIFCCENNEFETFLLEVEMKRRRRLQRFNSWTG